MSSCLIGYLVKGPLEISIPSDEIIENHFNKITEKSYTHIDHREREVLSVFYDEEEVIQDYSIERFKEDLEKFVIFWNDEIGSDISSRLDPDDDKQKLLFAGDSSWGDQPDGYGYEMLTFLEHTQSLDLFGIR